MGVPTSTVVTSGVAMDSVTGVSVVEVPAFWIFVVVESVLKVSNEGASSVGVSVEGASSVGVSVEGASVEGVSVEGATL